MHIGHLGVEDGAHGVDLGFNFQAQLVVFQHRLLECNARHEHLMQNLLQFARCTTITGPVTGLVEPETIIG